MTSGKPRQGRIGIWSLELRFGDRGEAADAAAELDELGYAALWVPGGAGGDISDDFDRLLDATSRTTIATGILNIWKHEPAEIAGWWKALPGAKRERVLLGLGVSHAHVVGEAYVKPLSVMRDYLARLDDAGLPPEARCLAALGPKMLELAGDRTVGVHPYLITPAHTALAREALGPDKLVAPLSRVLSSRPTPAARGTSPAMRWHTINPIPIIRTVGAASASRKKTYRRPATGWSMRCSHGATPARSPSA
jgi:probable F420-dependent oxidoreductase